MTRESQKKEERLHLEKAMYLLDIPYQIISEQEPPDFVVQVGNDTIGIEITKSYRSLSDGGNSAKQEYLLKEITEKSIQIFEKNGGPNMCFAIGYDGNKYIKNNREFTKQLVDYLIKYCQSEGNQQKTLPHSIPLQFSNHQELIPINSIHIGQSQTNKPCGIAVSSFDTTVIDQLTIETNILKKSSDIKEYKCCPTWKWLIIVLPSMIMASDLQLPKHFSVSIQHHFDKIYLVDIYRNSIIGVSNENT